MEYSLADIRAVSNSNEGMFGGSSWLIVIFFVFILFGFGGNGFGRGGNGDGAYATAADLQRGFDTNAVTNKLNGLENGLSSLGFTLQSQIATCCCETNRNIDDVKLGMCQQTNTIVNAIHSDGEATRALITGNIIQTLRDEKTALQLGISQSAQTANILDSLGRYVTNPPCNPQPCGTYGLY